MNEYIQDLASIDYLSLITSIVIIMGVVVSLKSLIEKFCETVGIEFSWIRERNIRKQKNEEMKECQSTIKRELRELRERQDVFEKEHRENIEKRDEFDKEIISAINTIKDSIVDFKADIERKEAEKKFEKLRDDIVNFANELALRDTVSSELMENVYRKINVYHSLSEEYGFKNSQAPVSIDAIKQKYQEMILSGHITKKEED